MNRRRTTAGALATLTAAAALTVTTTLSTADAATSTITLTAMTSHETVVSADAPDHPIGNEFVSAHRLFRGGRQVGVDGAVCQIIDLVGAESMRVQCVASLRLPKGSLTAQGLPTFVESGDQSFTLAVTGGTGAYASARGQVTVRPVDAHELRYSITLEH